MRRLAVFLPQVVLAVVAGIAIGLLWLARDDTRDGTGPPPKEAIAATGRFTPDTHAFGEPVVAHVDVVVDNRSVDPASVQAAPEFAPYDIVGEKTVERFDAGATTTVRFSFPLRCLAEGCDPSGATGAIDFPTSRVTYRFVGQQGRAVDVVDWLPVTVTGRVADDAVTDIRWRASETALAAPTYRADPVTLAALLFAGALLLAALAAWISWRLWRSQPEVADVEGADVVVQSALDRALDSAKEASRNGDVGARRRALERVSRELTAVGLPALATDASVLAWSAGGSSEQDVDDLAHRTSAALDGGGEPS